MEDRQSRRQRRENLWIGGAVLGFVMIIALLAAIDYLGYGPDLGFRESTFTKETTRNADERTLSDGSVIAIDVAQDPLRAKTFWDWLQLLIVPMVLAGVATVGGFLLNRAQRGREQRIEEQRTQDAALQAYLNEMFKLLVEDRLRWEPRRHGDTRVTARALTLAVLSQLKDADHKRRVLQFLREARLISSKELHILEGQPIYPNIVGLEGADLTDAKLSGLKLADVDLSGANLSGADLTDADLSKANLCDTKLQEVNLSGAKLRNAQLPRPTAVRENLAMEWLDAARDEGNLNEANLTYADLTRANLAGAVLYKATLIHANLTKADLKEADLAEAKLGSATLDGADLKAAILRRADLKGAMLEGCNLVEAELSEADFEGANIKGADLQGAHGLKKKQLEQALGDKTTKVAEDLRPETWS